MKRLSVIMAAVLAAGAFEIGTAKSGSTAIRPVCVSGRTIAADTIPQKRPRRRNPNRPGQPRDTVVPNRPTNPTNPSNPTPTNPVPPTNPTTPTNPTPPTSPTTPKPPVRK